MTWKENGNQKILMQDWFCTVKGTVRRGTGTFLNYSKLKQASSFPKVEKARNSTSNSSRRRTIGTLSNLSLAPTIIFGSHNKKIHKRSSSRGLEQSQSTLPNLFARVEQDYRFIPQPSPRPSTNEELAR